jgi:Protein of unknown function (DUF2844)
MIDRSFKYSLGLMAGMIMLCGGSARAALGGDAASVRADTDEMHGVVRSTLLQYYDVQEITTDSGMRVREFLNRNGIIFAVTWSGPAMPDLQRLLGTHFAAYTKALTELNQSGLQKSLRIASSELVVESGGHLRAYAGRAYLPALIPSGTPASDLR